MNFKLICMKSKLFYLLFLLTIAINVVSQVKVVKGLAVIAEFDDYIEVEPDSVIDSLLNQRNGFNLHGNAGSLNEYYRDQTNGKYDITHKLVRIRFNNKNASYFSQDRHPDTDVAWNKYEAFADSVLRKVKEQYPDGIPGLTRTNFVGGNGIFSFLIIYPHGYYAIGLSNRHKLLSDGVEVNINHMGTCNIGNGQVGRLFSRILTHEASHAIFRLPDVGHQKGDNVSIKGSAGSYCIMGWNAGGSKSPIDFCAPLLAAIKTPVIVDIEDNIEKIYNIKSNARDTLYRYCNPNNPYEYFIFQSFNHSKWYPTHNFRNHPMDVGLGIWHVVEDRLEPRSPWFRLVQADGRDLMNDKSQTPPIATGNDNRVMFGRSVQAVDGETNQMLRWIDGSVPGLIITDISDPGPRMSFKVNRRSATINSRVVSGAGRIDLSGLISVNQGESKTFNIIPDWGYVVDQVWVNGIAQGSVTSYTFSNVIGDNVITASFKFPAQRISPRASGAIWSLVDVSSVDPGGNANNAFDDNPATYWQTNWTNNSIKFPHYIIINMGALHVLQGIGYLPRQDYASGRIHDFDIYVSVDNKNWHFIRRARSLNDTNYRVFGFNKTLAQYVKIVAISSAHGDKHNVAGAAEIRAYGSRYSGRSTLSDMEISKSNWQINDVSSFQPDYSALNLIDGNISSSWLSSSTADTPNYVDFDLGGFYDISRFSFLPRQDNINGRIAKYAIFISSDGVNWGDTISTGIWDNTANRKEAYFLPKVGRYIRLAALSEVNGNNLSSGSEVYAYGFLINENTSIKDIQSDFDKVLVYTVGKEFYVDGGGVVLTGIQVYDNLGRILYRTQLTADQRRFSVELNTGVYILKLMAQDRSILKKIVVKSN